MKQKLTKAQKETLDALKTSQGPGRASLEVGPGLVEPRTAEALVRKGYCVYDLSPAWGDNQRYRIIRLAEQDD